VVGRAPGAPDITTAHAVRPLGHLSCSR
jgi:hypothetical protein